MMLLMMLNLVDYDHYRMLMEGLLVMMMLNRAFQCEELLHDDDHAMLLVC